MTNRNHAAGAETERMAAKYLRGTWTGADRRLREGRADDQGDIDGVPLTTIQIKRAKQPRLQTWVEQTLKQRDEAGNPLCLLIVRKMQKAVGAWDAYMPVWQATGLYRHQEREAWTWVRMDLAMAVIVLRDLIAGEARPSPSPPSSSTTG
ncbi:hypothetical protein ACK1X7_07240 [Streptomyces sp. CY1]|uniref:hypothetical protein n=1 Tax=Streptomyces sp. CY1 TaxID=3388313 RepID=UPI0039A09462